MTGQGKGGSEAILRQQVRRADLVALLERYREEWEEEWDAGTLWSRPYWLDRIAGAIEALFEGEQEVTS